MRTIATRRERVVLDLESNLPEGMLRGAAATQVLRMELERLSGASVRSARASADIDRDINKVDKSATKADKSINQLTGRLRLFADIAAVLGPALVPIGGVGVAGVAALASQMGFAAIAGGVLIGSMQGLGDALTALNKAHLEPTTENLTKAEDALNSLSPAAADFAREAYAMLPALRSIRDAGAEGIFPGLTESLDNLERRLPVVTRIFEGVGEAIGDIASGGTASLASGRWGDFFRFIEDEAPRAISELATTVGSLTHGLAELWMAFAPLNRDASGWLMDVADGFDAWASGLAQTEGFRDFIAYIRETGPQVADTLGALANAVVQIVTAAAPLGGPTLAAIEGLANTLAFIADSGIGPSLLAAASAMALFTRATTLLEKATTTGLAALNPWVLGIGATAGLLLAVEQKADAAAGGIDRFNAAIKAGSISEATAGIADMEKRLADLKGTDLASITFSSVGNLIAGKSVQDEIDETTLALDAAKGAVADLTAEQERAASSQSYRNSLEAETAALEKNIAAMQAKRDEALRSFSAQTNYSQSLLDSKNALEENGRAWNLNTDAGLKNRRVVEQQASSWNELNRTQGQTPGQARAARKALEDTAVSLGASREEARRYARQLMDIPNDLTTKIALDVDTAIQRAQAIKRELASIDRNIDVYVNVRRPNAGGMGPQVGSYATGGYTGKGGKYEPAGIVHRGEIVLPQEIVNTDWSFLRSRYGHLPGFADGGFVGNNIGRPGAAGLDTSRLLNGAARNLERATQGQLDAATVLSDAANSQRDAVQAQMDSIRQGTISGFNSGLFDQSSNPWAKGAGSGPLFNLNKDIAGLQERGQLQQQLAALGLTGDAANALLTQGSNSQISALIASGQVGQYASLYQQRASLQGSVGAGAAQFAYGAAMESASDAANRAAATVARMEDLLKQQQIERDKRADAREERRAAREAANADRTGKAVGAVVTGTAVKGHRDKKNGGGK